MMHSNGLNYQVTGEPNVVSVGYNENVTGDVVIPEKVFFDGDGVPYIVTGIAEDAFVVRSDLTSIAIPASLKSIAYGAFKFCFHLTHFYVSPDNPVYCSVDGVLFSKGKNRLVVYPKGKSGDSYIASDSVV